VAFALLMIVVAVRLALRAASPQPPRKGPRQLEVD